MFKYQFHISFNDKANTAASKAVQDCKSVLTEMGYLDQGVEDIKLSDPMYKIKLVSRLFKFYLKIKPNSLIAVQYPLLSGNALFKYFIKASKHKRVRFFCIIHDLDDLRYTERKNSNSTDVDALNHYDYVIAHNEVMKKWLKDQGLSVPISELQAFDYLSVVDAPQPKHIKDRNTIAFAGNLSKSNFIYALDIINKWKFDLYGPNYQPAKGNVVKNICWNGSLSPDDVLTNLKGAFGLVWDGDRIDQLDAAFGNYLKYNYPHKLSLYLAAGLPVIAPRRSAISSFIEKHQVGVLVEDLTQLQHLSINEEMYDRLKYNAEKISVDMRAGKYFITAVAEVEAELLSEHDAVKINSIYN